MAEAEPSSAEPRPSGDRRAYALALIVLAASAAVAVVSYGMAWSTAQVALLAGSDEAMHQVERTGRDLYPGSAMAGWVALAAVLGLVATRSWGRIAVGVITALMGIAVAAGPVRLAATGEPRSGLWWLVALVAGAAIAAVGGSAAARGRRWPAMGGRYERPTSRRLSDWDAQDMGQDPTDDLVE